MEVFTGIDLHKDFMVVSSVDADGKLLRQKRVRNAHEDVARYFQSFDGTHHAVVESCLGWYWLRDLLVGLDVKLVMAHALLVKAIAYAKVKTDKIDSLTLANLLRTGMIPQSHMISAERRALRDLTRRRQRLVAELTRMSNAARGVLTAVNLRSADELELVDRASYDAAATMATALREQIGSIESLVASELAGDIDFLLLQTIPGIGPIHAAEILLESDGAARFASERKFFSYCRVVPGASNSGGRLAHKHGRQGNAYLRKALGDAAVHAIAQHSIVTELFKRWCKRYPEAQARTMIAKELARGAYHVMRNREAYRGLKGRALEKRKAAEPRILRAVDAITARETKQPGMN